MCASANCAAAKWVTVTVNKTINSKYQMQTLCCLLLLTSAVAQLPVPVPQPPGFPEPPSWVGMGGLRCLCDKGYCMTGWGPAEDCPDHVPIAFIERNISLYDKRLTESIASAKLQTYSNGASESEKQKATMEAKDVVAKMKTQDKINMLEYLGEIAFDSDAFTRGDGSIDKIQMKLKNVASGKADPGPVDNQFCLKTVGRVGLIKACGAAVTIETGPIYKNGCHVIEHMLETTIKYCKCSKYLCNAGAAISGSLTVSLLSCWLVLKDTWCGHLE